MVEVAFVLELQILLTALVVWGITHHIQVWMARIHREPTELWFFRTCNVIRLLAIAVAAVAFLVWVWRHLPTVVRSLCSL
jgi:hypothetical protein